MVEVTLNITLLFIYVEIMYRALVTFHSSAGDTAVMEKDKSLELEPHMEHNKCSGHNFYVNYPKLTP